MKSFKSSKAYGAFEYVTIIALIIAVAIIIMQMAKGKTIGSGNILDTALGKVSSVIGSTGGPGGEVVKEITVTYSGPFNYDYSKSMNDSITDYYRTSGLVEVKDKNGVIRTDYLLENISEVGEFFQVDIVIDGETKKEMRSINKICYLAKDSDFTWKTSSPWTGGAYHYTGTATECVEIPSTINGVNVISYQGMFSGTSVKKVISTNPNTTNMSKMFYNSQAKSLDLSNFDTSKVTTMEQMFTASKATSLDLSNFDTSKVTNMNGMFQNSQPTSINLSNFNTSNVTNMTRMFNNSQATSLDLSNFNTSKVTGMDYIFAWSQATSLDLSSFDTSNVNNMEGMFYNSQATSLDLSKLNTSNVTNMRSMFDRSQATSLDLSSFNTSNVNNMEGMFYSSQATTGYAKTIADADKFNASSNKPAGLIFTVK